MSVTTAQMNRFIILLFAILPSFSGSVFAQIEASINYSPVAEDYCGMNRCTADGTGVSLKIQEIWKPNEAALADISGNLRFSFSMKSEPETERDTGFQFIKNVATTPEAGNPVLPTRLAESAYTAVPYGPLRNENKSFGDKLLRAEILTHIAQISNLMMMISFPESFRFSCSSWAEAKSNLHRAWTSRPVWDKDPWTTDYVGHPYVGTMYYNMLRSQGASVRASFLYTTAQSLLWEFVIEAVAEQPSIQDLIVTSNLGSLFGELAHRATLRMKRNGFTTFEKILVTIINPIYAYNNGFNRRLRASASTR
jgi:hypothetical protein